MKRSSFPLSGCLLFIVLLSLLAGCVGQEKKTTYFLPPTPAGEERLTVPQAETGHTLVASLPTPTVQCRDNLAFLKDITIPDGTVVSPDSTLDKRWEVENNGNCNWAGDYRVRLIAGPELGVQKEQALYPARSGSRAVVRMVFKAPPEPGNYRSAWQAFNPKGDPFGDPFFIDIQVEAP